MGVRKGGVLGVGVHEVGMHKVVLLSYVCSEGGLGDGVHKAVWVCVRCA